MNIDWSKAPEDATHVGTKQVPGVTCWYKLKEGVFYFWYCTNDDLDFDGWAESKGDPIHTPLIERPKKQEAWDGNGKPPIGIECEVRCNDVWSICKTLAYHQVSDTAVAVHFLNGSNSLFWCETFRPIKTAEQLADEEREDAANKMFKRFGGIGGLTKKQCIWVISEGYRKQ